MPIQPSLRRMSRMSTVERSTLTRRGADTLRMRRRGRLGGAGRTRRFVALASSLAFLGAVVVAAGSQAAQHPVANEAVPPPADPATVPGYGRDPVSLLGPS